MYRVALAVVGAGKVVSTLAVGPDAHKVGGVLQVDVVGLLEVVAQIGLRIHGHALVELLQVVLVAYQVGVVLGAAAAEGRGIYRLKHHHLHQLVVAVDAGHHGLARVHIVDFHTVAAHDQAGRRGHIARVGKDAPHDIVHARHGEGVLHLARGLAACKGEGRHREVRLGPGGKVAECRVEACGGRPHLAVEALRQGAAGELGSAHDAAGRGVGHHVARHLLVEVAVHQHTVGIGRAIEALRGAHGGRDHLAAVVAAGHPRRVLVSLEVAVHIGHDGFHHIAQQAAHVLIVAAVDHDVAVVAVGHRGAIHAPGHAAGSTHLVDGAVELAARGAHCGHGAHIEAAREVGIGQVAHNAAGEHVAGRGVDHGVVVATLNVHLALVEGAAYHAAQTVKHARVHARHAHGAVRLEVGHGAGLQLAYHAAGLAGSRDGAAEREVAGRGALEGAYHAAAEAVVVLHRGPCHGHIAHHAARVAHHDACVGARAGERRVVDFQVLDHTLGACHAEEALTRLVVGSVAPVLQGIALAVEGALKGVALIAHRPVGLGKTAHVDVGSQRDVLALVALAQVHTLGKGQVLVEGLDHIGVGLGARAAPVEIFLFGIGHQPRGKAYRRVPVAAGHEAQHIAREYAPRAQRPAGGCAGGRDRALVKRRAVPVVAVAVEVAIHAVGQHALRCYGHCLVGVEHGIDHSTYPAEVQDAHLVGAHAVDIHRVAQHRRARARIVDVVERVGHHGVGHLEFAALEAGKRAALVVALGHKHAPAGQRDAAVGIEGALDGVLRRVGVGLRIIGAYPHGPVGGVVVDKAGVDADGAGTLVVGGLERVAQAPQVVHIGLVGAIGLGRDNGAGLLGAGHALIDLGQRERVGNRCFKSHFSCRGTAALARHGLLGPLGGLQHSGGLELLGQRRRCAHRAHVGLPELLGPARHRGEARGQQD